MSTIRPSAADHPTAVFYRRTLIDLDKSRVDMAAAGASTTVMTALDTYRATVQAALHEMGVRS